MKRLEAKVSETKYTKAKRGASIIGAAGFIMASYGMYLTQGLGATLLLIGTCFIGFALLAAFAIGTRS